jgi:hypothetical protein
MSSQYVIDRDDICPGCHNPVVVTYMPDELTESIYRYVTCTGCDRLDVTTVDSDAENAPSAGSGSDTGNVVSSGAEERLHAEAPMSPLTTHTMTDTSNRTVKHNTFVCGTESTNELYDAGAIRGYSSLPSAGEMTVPIATSNGRRELKSSASADDCSHFNEDDGVPGQIRRTKTMDMGELSHESLRHAWNLFSEFACCPECSAVGRELAEVEGLKSLWSCTRCATTFGLDDTIDYYELMQDLKQGRYELEPCGRCGNRDPYRFVLCEVNDDVKQ